MLIRRSKRTIATLLLFAMIQSLFLGSFAARAAAAPVYQDPLEYLPDWANLLGGGQDPAAPPNPLAGLLPRNPLEGVVPTLPTPKAPAIPGIGAPARSNAPGPRAPGEIPIPNVPQAPDCGCNPDSISVSTGALAFSVKDLMLPGMGPDLALTRSYNSVQADKNGPFGYGWNLNLNNRLHMYVFHHITEHRGDGSRTSFDFTKGGGFVDSYDGDSLIHTDLSLGSYAPSDAPGWSLVREAADRYVVTRPDGTVYTYRGYHAAWRTNEDPRAGRLLSIRDRLGRTLTFGYNARGELTSVSDDYGRRLTLTWEGGHITQVLDHAGRTFTYTYAGNELVKVESKDHPTYVYTYDPVSHRLTNRSGGPEGSVTYRYDSEGRVESAGLAKYAYSANQTVYTDGAGQDWVFTLDDQKRVSKVTGPEGLATTTSYDSQGRVDVVAEPQGRIDHDYDEAGRLSVVNRYGLTTKTTYGKWSLPTEIATPVGATLLRYDPANGNLLGKTEPGLAEATYTYEAKGRVDTETTPGGQRLTYQYDEAAHGRPTRIKRTGVADETRTYDALGNIESVTDYWGFTTEFTYDKAGRLKQQTNPDGGVITYDYDGAGRLKKVSGPAGAEVNYDYAARGRVEKLAVKDGPTFTFGYDGVGRLTSAKDHHTMQTATWDRHKDGRVKTFTSLRAGVTTTYTYDKQGQVESVTGPLGTVTYGRDDQGRVSTVAGPGTRKVEYGYDAAGRINRATMGGISVSAVLDPLGRLKSVTTPTGQTDYQYDSAGRIEKVTYPDKRWVAIEYDQLERLWKNTTSSGLVTTYDYSGTWVTTTDTLHRTTKQHLNHRGQPVTSLTIDADTEKVWLASTYKYDHAGRVTAIQQGDEASQTFGYDAAGRLTRRTDSSLSSTHYAYDPHGRVVEVTDRREKVTKYKYDVQTNTVTISAPGVAQATYEYDPANRLAKAVDSGGTTTEWKYHPEGNLKSLTKSGTASRTQLPTVATWSWTYDVAGRMETATDARGFATTYHYDTLGRLEAVEDALQKRTKYFYDSLHRLKQMETPRGGVSTYDYDDEGRLAVTTEPGGGQWRYGYDKADRVISRTDPLQVTSTFSYTAAGQVAGISQPVDKDRTATIAYDYDKSGRLTGVTDARNQSRRFKYDLGGRLQLVIAPLGQTFEYDYNAEGQLTLAVDPMGRQTSYAYDDGGRLNWQKTWDGTITEYVYDGAGRLELSTTGVSTSRYYYDGLGRLEARKDPRGKLTSFEYDGNGNLTARVDDLGKRTEFQYDAQGRLTRETDRRGHFTEYVYDIGAGTTTVTDKEGEVQTYQFDVAGRLQTLTAPGRRVTTYGYDLAGRLTSIEDPMGNRREYEYNLAGWLVTLTEKEGAAARKAARDLGLPDEITITPERTQSYYHDVAGNVVRSTDPAGLTVSYSYDELGRRQRASWPGSDGTISSESWEYYADNQVKSHKDAAGGLTQYTYDKAARLESVTDPNGHTLIFGYNFRGQVTTRTDREGTTEYRYDPAGNLITFIDPRSQKYETEYVYDELNRLIERKDPEGNSQFFVYDPEGNLERRKDARGEWWLYDYDKLGRLLTQTDPNGNKTSYKYTPSGQVKRVEDALGRFYHFEYDALDRLIEQKLPGGIRQATAYDWRSNPIARKDGRGNTTYFAYDGADRMTAVHDPEGGVTRYTWDRRGFLTQIVDANEQPTVFERDPLGRTLSETNAAGETTRYTYDPAGNLLQKVDPLQRVKTYSYNHRGQITRIDYNQEEQATFQYDPAGNLVGATNPAASEEYSYDSLNRLTKVTDLTLQRVTLFGYDGEGLRTSVTDPEGRVTRYQYDKAGRLQQTTLPDEQTVGFGWDELNRLTSVSRHNGVTTAYEYNEAGWLKTLSHSGPGGPIAAYTYEYDDNGNKTRQTEEDEAVTTWTYDKLNRLVEVNYPRQKIEAIRSQYNVTPKAYRPAREGETDDPLPEEQASVAPRRPGPAAAKNQERAETVSPGGGNGGNADSERGKPADSEPGKPADSEPGKPADSEPAKPADREPGKPADREPGRPADSEPGRPAAKETDLPVDKGNGKPADKETGAKECPQPTRPQPPKKSNVAVKSYPELPEYLLEPTSKATYTYDKVGNRLSMTTDQGTTQYTYDSAYRLLTAGSASYSYDKVGNLIEKVTPDDKITYSYNAADKLTRVSHTDETYVTFAYDAFGRKVRRTEAAWVSRGNPNGTPPGLTDAKGWGNNSDRTVPGDENKSDQGKAGEKSQAKAGENGKGNEQGKAGPCTEEEARAKEPPGKARSAEAHKKLKLVEETTGYLYDGLGLNLLKEYKDRTAPKAEYYYANGQVLARKMFGLKDQITPDREAGLANGGTYYYLTDALGSVNDLTDQQGNVVRRYRYDAFGGLFTGAVGVYNTIGLTGKTYDAKAGLMDYSARWYDPTVGRFTQVDPFSGWLDLPQSRNPYAYVMNNPVMNTDTTGRATNVDVSPGEVFQGESVTISWYYDDYAHPTNVVIYHNGSAVGGGSYGSAQSGSMSWSTSTVGSYSVSVYPNDEFSQWGSGGSFVVKERPPIDDDDDDDDDDGDDDDDDDDTPHVPVITYQYGPWTEVGKVHHAPLETYSEGGAKRVDTTVTINEERWAKELADDKVARSWTETRSWDETFTRQFAQVKGGWILTSDSGSQDALTSEQKREYRVQISDYKTYQIAGVRPDSVLASKTVAMAGFGPAVPDPGAMTPSLSAVIDIPESPIGRIYSIRGTLNGEEVAYVGSTVQQLRKRFSNHEWKDLIMAESTTIKVYEVYGTPNVAASGRGTLRSAINEALRSVEQLVLNEVREVAKSAGIRVLNVDEAASRENQKLWQETHKVRLGTTTRTIPGGVKIGAAVGMTLLDAFLAYREDKLSQYVWSPYLLEDTNGVFTLQEQDRGIFRKNHYFKNYKTGSLAGQSVQIEKDEFNELREEAEALWGTVDWKGDFVPGILRRELPVIPKIDPRTT